MEKRRYIYVPENSIAYIEEWKRWYRNGFGRLVFERNARASRPEVRLASNVVHRALHQQAVSARHLTFSAELNRCPNLLNAQYPGKDEKGVFDM